MNDDDATPVAQSSNSIGRVLTFPGVPILNRVSLPSRTTSSNHVTKIRTLKTEIGPQFPSFTLPRRLFRWLYSVSLVILVTLLLAFIAVTPIDVIVQTSSASSSGIKLFIVIIVCVVFLVVSFVLYFLRLYQHRVSMNDIPTKSVYIPDQNDLPNTVFKYITQKFNDCQEIKEKADPLHDSKVNINHPGMSPPLYVQQRNESSTEKDHLPPNLVYEDAIRSFGDKFNFHDGFKTSVALDIPKDFSLRQICMFLISHLLKEGLATPEELPDVETMLSIYEKSKFGGHLLTEEEMIKFSLSCGLVGDFMFVHYGTIFAYRRRKNKVAKANDIIGNSLLNYSQSNASNSFFRNGYTDGEPYDEAELYDRYFEDEETIDPRSQFRRKSELSSYSKPSAAYSSQSQFLSSNYQSASSANLQSSSNYQSAVNLQSKSNLDTSSNLQSAINLPSFSRINSTPSRYRRESIDSSDSVIKRDYSQASIARNRRSNDSHRSIRNKLSITGDINTRKSSVTFDLGDGSSVKNHSKQNLITAADLRTPTSTVYHTPEGDPEKRQPMVTTDDQGIYSFRGRVIPQFNLVPSSPVVTRERLPSPSTVLELEIRLNSPKRTAK